MTAEPVAATPLTILHRVPNTNSAGRYVPPHLRGNNNNLIPDSGQDSRDFKRSDREFVVVIGSIEVIIADIED